MNEDKQLFSKHDMIALIIYCCRYFRKVDMDEYAANGMYQEFIKTRK